MNLKLCKYILFVFLIYVLATSGASCSIKNNNTNANNSSSNPPPKMKLEQPVYTEIKKNTIIYKGIALSAEYFGKTKPGIVVRPFIDGVLNNGEPFSVSSDMGYYDENTQVIKLNDNITAVLNKTYILKSNAIEYFLNKKLIVSDQPITVYGKDLQLFGDEGSIDLEKDILSIQGNINAKIYNMKLR